MNNSEPTLSVCYIVQDEEHGFLRYSLEAIKDIADEIIIIDGGSKDGTIKMLDSLEIPHMKIFHHKYTNNGLQRNQYLRHATCDWVLVLDSDEIVSDDVFRFKDVMKNSIYEVFDVHMIHFMWNLGMADATVPRHYVPRRFFKRTDKLRYPPVEHPVLEGFVGEVDRIHDVTIFHYDAAKGVLDTVKKYKNHMARSNIHSKEFLNKWKDWRIYGTYPTRPYEGEQPSVIKKLVANI